MNRKINCVMLVDDNEADNYLHRMVLEEANCTDQIVEVFNGKQAIDYLKENVDNKKYPDLIFLDINMPVMDGWEFIEAYNKAEYNTLMPIIIVMLTTSINPDDIDKAQHKEIIADFSHKPLNSEELNKILTKYFD